MRSFDERIVSIIIPRRWLKFSVFATAAACGVMLSLSRYRTCSYNIVSPRLSNIVLDLYNTRMDERNGSRAIAHAWFLRESTGDIDR